ncbi:MAG: hypothetical protein CYPHOPRED_002467 [Cyphobasidiales sp. Tagirdzhanova-0007]|nr:MAG: hypothetical protein CYPHOPRED_002467 [Cyphobasidiales sp. Tagirdzhanova-0007]
MKIQGNTFIVTGGTGGIGGAVARSLIKSEAKVVLFDVIANELGEGVAAEMGGKDALYIRVDITNSDAVKGAVKKAVDTFGNLAGCVHCAGIAIKRAWSNDVADSIPDFQKMLNVNTSGTFIVNAHVADAINASRNHPEGSNEPAKYWTSNEERGIIINFASAAAHGCYARTLCYAPTKVAVLGITRTMSDFLGPSGIRVCSVSPSIVASAMTANFNTYFSDDLLKHATFPRVPATPDEVAATVQYIIENKFLNGVDIPLDGGWRLVTQKPGLEGGMDPRELAPGLE